MRSMTGFGQASWEGGGRRLSVEIRGVNQRFLDVRFSLPRNCQAWEQDLRREVQGRIGRGKVEITISRSGPGAAEYTVECNERLARELVDSFRRLCARVGLEERFDARVLLTRPEIMRVVERRDAGESDLPRVRQLLRRALRMFEAARRREGRALAADMRRRLRRLRALRAAMERRSRRLTAETAARLKERVGALLEGAAVSEERLLQEVALLAERADVTEELVRLASHLESFEALLREEGPVGKRLDFLLQEMHREVNTIASKTPALEITQLTLEARADIEKLREQVQNVE